MTSTEFSIGMSGERNSSRVLKPPGGGHTDLFGGAEVKVNNPRPKYDQQNSSNLNFCMNTTDANILLQQTKQEIESSPPKSAEVKTPQNGNENGNSQAASQAQSQPKGRVPPGGHSSGGFW